VGLVGLKVEQMAGAQLAGLAVDREVDPALQAMDRDRPLVEWVGISLPRGTTSRMTSRPSVLIRAVVFAPAKAGPNGRTSTTWPGFA
jgi:hypothetical protein